MLPRKIQRINTPDSDTGCDMSNGETVGKGKVGGLKDILEMPVDIILEVSSCSDS